MELQDTEETTTTFPPDVQELLRRMQDGSQEKQFITEHHIQIVALTVAELKQAIAHNPTHPLAGDFANAIANLPDTYEINVEQPTLQALIHNRPLITRKEVIDGKPILTKHLG